MPLAVNITDYMNFTSRDLFQVIQQVSYPVTKCYGIVIVSFDNVDSVNKKKPNIY